MHETPEVLMTNYFPLENYRMDKTISTTAKALMWILALVAGWIVQIPSLVGALMALMAIDMVTGVLSAWRRHAWESSKATDGVITKAMVLLVLLAMHIAEQAASEVWKMDAFELNADRLLTMGFMFAELISIVENCAIARIWMPAWLIENLIRFKKVRVFRQATDAQLRELVSKRKPEDPDETDY